MAVDTSYVRQLKKILKGTPMAPHARLIATVEARNRLPKGLLAGIARAESSFGTAGRPGHHVNPFGWMKAGGPAAGLMQFSNMAEAIRHVGRTLGQRGWRDPSKFGGTYVLGREGPPPSVWLNNVRSVMSQVGGGVPTAPPGGGGGGRGGRRGLSVSSNRDRMQTLLALVMARRSGASGVTPILLQALLAPPSKTKTVTKDGVELGPGVTVSGKRGKVVRNAIQIAKRFIGTPYDWGSPGGRSDFSARPRAFDCSGFIAYVWFKATGKKLPAYTGDLVRLGRSIPRGQIQPGDAVFFDTNQKFGHVGMYIGGGKFIHASSSGSVKISSLANYPYKPSAIRRYDV